MSWDMRYTVPQGIGGEKTSCLDEMRRIISSNDDSVSHSTDKVKFWKSRYIQIHFVRSLGSSGLKKFKFEFNLNGPCLNANRSVQGRAIKWYAQCGFCTPCRLLTIYSYLQPPPLRKTLSLNPSRQVPVEQSSRRHGREAGEWLVGPLEGTASRVPSWRKVSTSYQGKCCSVERRNKVRSQGRVTSFWRLFLTFCSATHLVIPITISSNDAFNLNHSFSPQ